jgi:uncharacterized protein with gpF-like domain
LQEVKRGSEMTFLSSFKIYISQVFAMYIKKDPSLDNYINTVGNELWKSFFNSNQVLNKKLVEKEVIRLSNFYKVPYKFNKDVMNRIVGVSTFTGDPVWTSGFTKKQINSIKRIVTSGIYGDKTESQVQEELMNRVGMAKRQAQLIARNETQKLKNTSVQMYYETPEVKAEYDKVWVSEMDDRTREDHREMNGQIADPVTGLFTTTWGESLNYPGSGYDVGQNINCRCKIILRKRK